MHVCVLLLLRSAARRFCFIGGCFVPCDGRPEVYGPVLKMPLVVFRVTGSLECSWRVDWRCRCKSRLRADARGFIIVPIKARRCGKFGRREIPQYSSRAGRILVVCVCLWF
ncbi:hypothetical protein B0T24DRAFT_238621 [Lasiosphaeria ovina]|uniref:Secreted protein n=1 Tax=Lasiosphaeria ovina TaxID=92902 RepID=A0AAE0NC93_9PEZI|nr:hypothetical protein B0T24DRAFT_238621 [Lasiosphaeria ovina]